MSMSRAALAVVTTGPTDAVSVLDSAALDFLIRISIYAPDDECPRLLGHAPILTKIQAKYLVFCLYTYFPPDTGMLPNGKAIEINHPYY
ncbi:hypothetical protein EVAR_98318_1 [Eumeta japonica]|uniref:Uncharacterized protein n=1 Tax=Eumeta variegata TaxID=151549 RepID=A0A4C1XBR8_EUMVA|nr:hypothetical protein EVAR_98318_1 [Eumeta japonica]